MTQKIDPITGKPMKARTSKAINHDPVEPKPLPAKVTTSETDKVTKQLADIRQKWVDIGPGKRSGLTGDKLMKEYRRLSLMYWHLTGNHPPLIHADM